MTFVHHACEWGELDTPLAVTCVVRPEWVEAIVAEPGVVDCSIPAALALYSGTR